MNLDPICRLPQTSTCPRWTASSVATPALAALALAAITLIGGCSRAAVPPAVESATEAASPAASDTAPSTARTYPVRARLVRLNTRARPPQVDIDHESIPDLVGPSGEIEGMHSMVMPFPVAETDDLHGLAEGDLIEVDLTVDWEADSPAVITAIRPLPPTTELDLD